MLNIFGLTLSFIGSFISLATVITSKYKKDGITYDEMRNLGREFRNQKNSVYRRLRTDDDWILPSNHSCYSCLSKSIESYFHK